MLKQKRIYNIKINCFPLVIFKSIGYAGVSVEVRPSQQPALAGARGLVAEGLVPRGRRLQQQHAARPRAGVAGAAVHQQVREHHHVAALAHHRRRSF